MGPEEPMGSREDPWQPMSTKIGAQGAPLWTQGTPWELVGGMNPKEEKKVEQHLEVMSGDLLGYKNKTIGEHIMRKK